jgi:cyclophilin family peptidyl-prolyl cis-trans isomerase
VWQAFEGEGIVAFGRLGKLLFDRSRTTAAPVRQAMIEPLEDRQFLASTLAITSVIADNRGEVQIQLNNRADPATVTRSAVQVYTAGDDGKLGTRDDVKVRAAVGYSVNAKRISIRGSLPANTLYRVRIVSSRLHDLNGKMIDGEFKGSFPTGNGKYGGNLEIQTRADVSSTPTVRMVTTAGVINLKLLLGDKPITAGNFLNYANSGRYDNLFWTRSINGFVIQAGGLQIDPATNTVAPTLVDAPIVNEFDTGVKISNRRGTVAFAKQSGDPDSATNQFFFNLTDNGGDSPYSLDQQNGGFTVFAKLADTLSYAVMDQIEFYQTVALHNPLSGDGVLPDYTPVGLTDVPVLDQNVLTGEVQTVEVQPDPLPPRTQFVVTDGLDPSANLVMIKRTAELMKIARI